MLNINNTVNYEINVKQKYSWSTVFAWLYLKTIGRILPKKWNKWAENILSNKVTFQDTTMQTECIETTDKSVGADLKPEVAEKGSQSEVISKDGEVQTDGVALITEEDDEALKEQLEGINQELELERLQNASLKEENRELRSAIEGLEKSYKGLTEDAGKREEELTKYKQDKKAMQDKVDEQQKTIFDQYMIIREQGDEIEATRKDNQSLQAQIIELKSRLKDKEDKLIELNQQWQASKLVASLKSQTDKLWQARDKNTELENKVSDLGHENEALRLSVNTLTAQLEKERIDLESKLKDLSSQLSAAEIEKKSSENEVARLQEQVEHLNAELERVRSIAISSIGECTKTLDENLKLKNQQIESSTTEHGQQNAKEKSRNGNVQKGQTKVQKPDAESCMGTVSKTTNRIKGIPNSLINSSVSVQQSSKIR